MTTFNDIIKEAGLRIDLDGNVLPKRINHQVIDILITAGMLIDNLSWPMYSKLLSSLQCTELILDHYGKNRGLEFTHMKGDWYCSLKADRQVTAPTYGIAESKFRSAVCLLFELNIEKRKSFTKIKSV